MNSGTKDYIAIIKEMYSEIPAHKQREADELIKRLAELLEMMDECKEHIAREGCVVEMSQGKYYINRENPYSRIYDSKHKLMLSTMDKLDKMTPDAGSKKDDLMAFLEMADDVV